MNSKDKKDLEKKLKKVKRDILYPKDLGEKLKKDTEEDEPEEEG